MLVAGDASADCDAVERILASERGFTVTRARTVDTALAELALCRANGRTWQHFDCCVLARELDASAMEVANAAKDARPEPFLVALESDLWRGDERIELEQSGARILPVPITPRHLLDLLEKGQIDPVRHLADEHHVSPRGYQVLSLGVRGAGDPQIASILGITESTVQDHWKAAWRTVHADGRIELIAYVARYIAKQSLWPPLAC